MAISTVDYEKVDPFLFSIIQALNSIQNMVSGPNMPPSSNTVILINAIDAVRNDVGVEIEKQGTRTIT